MRRLFLCAFLFFLSGSLFSQIDLSSGLIACYKFSGNANDRSGNEYHGSVNGATLTTDRNGVANQAYYFNGSGNYIEIPALPLKNANYTYSVWAKGSSIPAEGNVGNIFSIGDPSGQHQTINFANVYASAQFVGIAAGGFNDGSGPGVSAVPSGILPIVGEWYHIVSVRSTSEVRLYINGVLIGTSSTGSTLPHYGSSTTAIIGTRCNFIQPFHGVIDDITLYDRALIDAEVLELYQNGAPCNSPETPPTIQVSSCGTDSFVLTAVSTLTCKWYDSEFDGNLIYEGNPFTTPEISQTTFYYVSNYLDGNESPRSKVTVEIFSQPEVTCNFPDSLFINYSNEISVNVSSGTAPFTYLFNFGDNQTNSTKTSTTVHDYEEIGTYPITVSVTDDNGCQSNCSSVVQTFEGEIPTFQASRCGEGSFTLEAASILTCRWYNSEFDGNLLYEGNPFTTPEISQPTFYYVSNYLDGNEGPRSKVTVEVFPQPEIICDFPHQLFIGESNEFSVETLSGTAPFTYLFDFGDNQNKLTPFPTTVHDYEETATYSLTVNVTDVNGCQSDCSSDVQTLEVFIPNVITPNGDSLNGIFTLFGMVNGNYELYTGDEKFLMIIYNRWGEEIFKTNDITTGWQGSDKPVGVYYFLINFGGRDYKGWVQVIF